MASKYKAVEYIAKADGLREIDFNDFKHDYGTRLYYQLLEQKLIEKKYGKFVRLTEKGKEFVQVIKSKKRIKVTSLHKVMRVRLLFILSTDEFTIPSMAKATETTKGLITDFMRIHKFLFKIDKSEKAYKYTLKDTYREDIQRVLNYQA